MKYFNNPLNIRSGSKWLGLRGNRSGFCEFETISCCVRAGLYLLLKNYPKHKVLTLEQCIYRWAPPSENSTINYVGFVEKKSGVKRSAIVKLLNCDRLYSVISAMCLMETGYKLSRNDFDIAYYFL